MSTQQYLDTGRDHQHGHAGPELTLSKSPSTAGAYASQEFSTQTPYSAVSSFNLPASCDSSLLTPVSNSPSPPMHNRTPKPMRRYHPSPPGISQQPSPPTSNQALWPSQVGGGMSQASSPMSVQAQSADSSFSMLPFMRTEVTPTSITPFLGHYAVSENTSSDQSPTSIHYGHMYPSVSIAQNPEVLVAQAQQEHMVLQNMIQQQQHHQQQHPQQQQRPMIQAPILTQPDPQHFRARQNSIHHHHGQQQQQHFPRGISDDSRVMKRQQSRSKAGSRRASRQATATAEGLELQPLRPAVDKNPPASRGSTSSSKSSAPPPKLELSDDCPEKLRYLLDLRYRFQDGKGKGMWETIHQRWADRYEPKAKEALQMDVNRAVYKYGIWPASEDAALLEAYRIDEENKMARITAHMKELGGGRYWDWKEKNIMKRLHELGLEEIISDPSTGAISRRKRRVRRDDGSEQLAEGWSQHGEVGGHHNGNHLMAAAVAVTVSSPQKLPQELESQLFQTLVKVETRDSPASVGGGAGSSSDQPQYGSAMEHNQQHRQRQRAASGAGSASESERLARQVCAQMMQERHH